MWRLQLFARPAKLGLRQHELPLDPDPEQLIYEVDALLLMAHAAYTMYGAPALLERAPTCGRSWTIMAHPWPVGGVTELEEWQVHLTSRYRQSVNRNCLGVISNRGMLLRRPRHCRLAVARTDRHP